MQNISSHSKDVEIVFITTVGTSIFDNLMSNSNEEVKNIIDNIIKLDYSSQEYESQPDEFEKEANKEYKERNINIKTLGLSSLENDNNSIIKYSAELSTIFTYLKNQKAKEVEVILIPTISYASFFCAKLISEYLNEKKINNKIKLIKYLSTADSRNFAEEGLKEFLNEVFRIRQELINQDKEVEVILNPTGGYKSLFPLMTIVGILVKSKVIYKYETSESIVLIPPLPLSIDINLWQREISKIELIEDNPNMKIDNISPQFRVFITEDIKGKLITTPIYEFFKETYSHFDNRFNTLYMITKNTSFLDFLNSELKKFYLDLSNIGHLIWKGDRVPEMVDHGIKHHTDLFIIAEKFLLYILDKNSSFLSDTELFILLCAILFHDCGHVVGTIMDANGEMINLLPDEIRDFHHILGFERLRNYNDPHGIYLSKPIYDNLKNWADSREEIWFKYLRAPAIIGLYHRKKMPLLNKDKFYDEHLYLFGEKKESCDLLSIKSSYQKFPALCLLNDVEFNGEKISPNRLLLICSLLRIIDSLDNQVKRTGDIMEIEFHKSQIETEQNEYELKAERILNQVDTFYAELAEDLRNIENKSASDIRKFLNKVKSERQIFYNLTEEYIWSRMKANFKKKQNEHFEKHKDIEKIKFIVPTTNIQTEIDNIQIKIDIELNKQLPEEEKLRKRSEVLKEMESEYTANNDEVKQIMNENKICLIYGDQKNGKND